LRWTARLVPRTGLPCSTFRLICGLKSMPGRYACSARFTALPPPMGGGKQRSWRSAQSDDNSTWN